MNPKCSEFSTQSQSGRLENLHCFLCLSLQMYVNLLFWYQFFCGFSGAVMSNSWVLILFNLIFTSIPPLVYGVLDKDMASETLMELPELYQNSKVSAHSQCTMQPVHSFSWSISCHVNDIFVESKLCVTTTDIISSH